MCSVVRMHEDSPEDDDLDRGQKKKNTIVCQVERAIYKDADTNSGTHAADVCVNGAVHAMQLSAS